MVKKINLKPDNYKYVPRVVLMISYDWQCNSHLLLNFALNSLYGKLVI